MLLSNVDQLYMSDEKNGADDDASRNKIGVETAGERNENRAMDLWSEYSKDAPIERV